MIAATKNKSKLGIWYVEIPNNIVYDPLGRAIDPKIHKGSRFVLIRRKRVPVSKLPHLTGEAIKRFKEIFC